MLFTDEISTSFHDPVHDSRLTAKLKAPKGSAPPIHTADIGAIRDSGLPISRDAVVSIVASVGTGIASRRGHVAGLSVSRIGKACPCYGDGGR